MTAGGNDDEGSALGNDDDAMHAIHSNDRQCRTLVYITKDKRSTLVDVLQILSLFNDHPNALNTANRMYTWQAMW